jgi:hypothetical protein
VTFTLPGRPAEDDETAPHDSVPEPAGDLIPGMGEPEPGPAPEPGPGTSAGNRNPEPEPGATSRDLVPAPARVGLLTHLWLTARESAARFSASRAKHNGFLAWAWEKWWGEQPESLRQHRAAAKSRSWVPDYLTGWLRAFAVKENAVFCATIGRAGVAAGVTLIKIFGRQSHFWLAVAAAAAAALIWISAH